MTNGAIRVTFKPPAMGRRHVPIRIAGEGDLRITPDALLARGFRARSGWPAVLVFVVVAAAGITAGQVFYGGSPTAIAYPLLGALVAAAMTPRGASRAPLELAIPWRAIRKIEMERTDEVLIVVDDHDPRGAIHVRDLHARELMAQLDQARIAHK